MNEKINIILDHSSGSWEYAAHYVYDIQDENGSPIFQAALYLKNKDGEVYESVGLLYKTIEPIPLSFKGFRNHEWIRRVARKVQFLDPRELTNL